MLSGENPYIIDVKGRVKLPNKFKDDFGKKIIVTRGIDRCLFVFSEEKWRELNDKMNTLTLAASLDIQRLLIGSKEELELDKQGRFLIPANLRKYAALDKDVVVVGIGTRAEIWNSDNWEAFNDKLIENSEAITAKMETLGL